MERDDPDEPWLPISYRSRVITTRCKISSSIASAPPRQLGIYKCNILNADSCIVRNKLSVFSDTENGVHYGRMLYLCIVKQINKNFRILFTMAQEIITRQQAQEIKEGLIKARQNKDMKEYTRLSTIIQKGIVAILESYGVSGIALKYKNRPEYRYIRIIDPKELDDWGDCFLECCETAKDVANPDDFMAAILSPDVLVAILNRIDRYKELGIPASEWHKGIDTKKYSSINNEGN